MISFMQLMMLMLQGVFVIVIEVLYINSILALYLKAVALC